MQRKDTLCTQYQFFLHKILVSVDLLALAAPHYQPILLSLVPPSTLTTYIPLASKITQSRASCDKQKITVALVSDNKGLIWPHSMTEPLIIDH